MTEKINLAELRPKVERESAQESTYSVSLRADEVLALIEAVEAARYLRSGAAGDVGTLIQTQRAFDEALARFDFGGEEPYE